MTIIDKEREFHDNWAKAVNPAQVKVDQLGTACTMPETRFILSKFKKHLKGAKLLEIGCGCGEASVYFAKCGADVYATDLSEGMVELAKHVAEYHGTTIHTVVCPAERLPFDDNSFDFVYAANILHHVDIKTALKEIKRVLKPDGVLLAWDPIKYNPAINIYRRLASGVRTEDEHPVDVQYLQDLRVNFSRVYSKGFWLLTNLIFVKYYFIDKVDPNKERYWKKIIDDAEVLQPLYNRLKHIDDMLLKMFPTLKWMCWNMVIFATNKERKS